HGTLQTRTAAAKPNDPRSVRFFFAQISTRNTNTTMNDNRLARSRPPSVLVTERLILRPPSIEDALALYELASADESFTRATFGTEPKSLEGTCTAIARMLADRQSGSAAWWIVTEKDSERIIGLSGFTEREPESGLINALARDALG